MDIETKNHSPLTIENPNSSPTIDIIDIETQNHNPLPTQKPSPTVEIETQNPNPTPAQNHNQSPTTATNLIITTTKPQNHNPLPLSISTQNDNPLTIEDIATNIFSRLDIKSLFISRSISKTWCSIIDNPQFPPIHLSNTRTLSTPPSIIILPEDPERCKGQLYITNNTPNPQNQNNTNTRNSSKVKLNIPFSDDESYMFTATSNGMICFCCWRIMHNFDVVIVVVSNPATVESARFPILQLSNKTANVDTGFGWVPSTNEFKVVCIVNMPPPREFGAPKGKSEVYVHTLGSNKWRMIGEASKDYIYGIADDWVQSSLVLVNVVLHSLSFDDDSDDERDWEEGEDDDGEETMKRVKLVMTKICIVSFDLESEKFGVVEAPEFEYRIVAKNKNWYHLKELQGKLAIMDGSFDDRYEIWVMKYYGFGDTWARQYVVRKNLIEGVNMNLYQTVCLRENGELVIMCGGLVLISYNLESGAWTVLEDGRLLKWDKDYYYPPVCQAIPYVGTLISLKSVCRIDECRKERRSRKRRAAQRKEKGTSKKRRMTNSKRPANQSKEKRTKRKRTVTNSIRHPSRQGLGMLRGTQPFVRFVRAVSAIQARQSCCK